MSKVTLIARTVPVNKAFSSQDLIAYMAKVSNPKKQDDMTSATRLIKYLVQHNHWSPFEMVSLTIEIRTTRDISRQILRHRSFSFQEFSQRYAEVDDAFFVTDREARLQDYKNRQNSIDLEDDPKAAVIKSIFEKMQKKIAKLSSESYQKALKLGLAKEVARALLPEGLTETTLYMSGTLRSWIHYILLRESNGTQKEHMEIATRCKEILFAEFPILADIWDGLSYSNEKTIEKKDS